MHKTCDPSGHDAMLGQYSSKYMPFGSFASRTLEQVMLIRMVVAQKKVNICKEKLVTLYCTLSLAWVGVQYWAYCKQQVGSRSGLFVEI